MLEETKKKNWIFSSAETWMIYDVALSAYVQTCSGKHYNPSSTTPSSRLKLFCNFLLFQYFSIYILSFFHFSMKFKETKKHKKYFVKNGYLSYTVLGHPRSLPATFECPCKRKISYHTLQFIAFCFNGCSSAPSSPFSFIEINF